jgi:hypothetical protein
VEYLARKGDIRFGGKNFGLRIRRKSYAKFSPMMENHETDKNAGYWARAYGNRLLWWAFGEHGEELSVSIKSGNCNR